MCVCFFPLSLSPYARRTRASYMYCNIQAGRFYEWYDCVRSIAATKRTRTRSIKVAVCLNVYMLYNIFTFIEERHAVVLHTVRMFLCVCKCKMGCALEDLLVRVRISTHHPSEDPVIILCS